MGIIKSNIPGVVLVRPTAQEVDLVSGKEGENLAGLIQDITARDGINPKHLTGITEIGEDFRSAINWQRGITVGSPAFEGDMLSDKTTLVQKSMGVVEEYLRRRTFSALNVSSVFVEKAGFAVFMHSCPVKWSMEHINERMEQRGSKPLDTRAPMFYQHNALALSMLRILEEAHQEKPKEYHPFILPERNGILLGHTVPITGEEAIRNRLAILGASSPDKLSTSPYEWKPSMFMTVRTFLGPQEMTRAQVDIRNNLSRFYTGERQKGLSVELDTMEDVIGSTTYKLHPHKYAYQKAFMELADIMETDEWHKAVKLPAHINPYRSFTGPKSEPG